MMEHLFPALFIIAFSKKKESELQPRIYREWLFSTRGFSQYCNSKWTVEPFQRKTLQAKWKELGLIVFPGAFWPTLVAVTFATQMKSDQKKKLRKTPFIPLEGGISSAWQKYSCWINNQTACKDGRNVWTTLGFKVYFRFNHPSPKKRQLSNEWNWMYICEYMLEEKGFFSTPVLQ